MPPESGEAEASEKPRSPWLRLGILGAVLLGLYLAGHFTGFNEKVSVESVRDTFEGAGILGAVGLQLAFAMGLLIQIPGMIFVAVDILIYGRVLGAVLGLFGGVFALSTSFLVVRAIGGSPLTELKSPFAIKVFSQLEERPIRTVIILRLLFLFAPPLNYALALSGIRFRDYVLGSLIGLTPALILSSLLFDTLFSYLAK